MEVENKSIIRSFWDEDFRILQPLWDLRIGYEKSLQSPLFPILLSIVFYFICVLPWCIIDVFGKNWKWAQRMKIQPDKPVTVPLVTKAVVLTSWNHLLYILPISVAQWVWTPDTPLPATAPPIWEFLWHQLAALIVFDFEYFAWHATHHKVRFLYKHVHALHHQYHAPHAWVTQYLHPWELISVGIFTTTSPWLFSSHPMTHWSFMLLSILISVEAHIGYDVPLMPHHWFPFWGGSIQHDMHHQRPLTNFSPFFNWWDRVFGWMCPGQLGGGYKPPALTTWEGKRKSATRRAASALEGLTDDKKAILAEEATDRLTGEDRTRQEDEKRRRQEARNRRNQAIIITDS